MSGRYLLRFIGFVGVFASLAEAVIIHDEAANSAYYNVTNSQFNGIGRVILSGGGACSAFAINSFQVLTAAHCIPGHNPSLNGLSLDGVRFSLFDSTTYAPTSVFVNPNWDINDSGGGYDIAVLYFANGLPSVNVYPVYEYSGGDDELGDSFELFGYGRCGTPQGGWNVGGGTCASPGLHRGANRVDNITPNGRLLQYSFDSYDPDTQNVNGSECRVNDGLCWATGNENQSKENVAEIGTRQGLFAPGDSGGPSLIFRGGQYYSVGLHSYISCIAVTNVCLFPPDYDGSTGPNGTWGEFNADTRLSAQTAFLAESVPEPTTFALFGFALFCLFARRHMLNSSKSVVRVRVHGEGSTSHYQAQKQPRR